MFPRKTITIVLVAGGVALAGLASAATTEPQYRFRFKANGVQAPPPPCQPGHQAFTFSAMPQTFIVPEFCEELDITVAGGDSGSTYVGWEQSGQRITTTQLVTSGNQLTIEIGAGGGVSGEWAEGSTRPEYFGKAGAPTMVLSASGSLLARAEGGLKTKSDHMERQTPYWHGAGGWALLEWGGGSGAAPVGGRTEVTAPEVTIPEWPAWFLDAGKRVPNDWETVVLRSDGAIPESPYPANRVNGILLYLGDAQSTEGLSSIEFASYVKLVSNNLANIDGLRNLKTVGDYLKVTNTNITNVDALSNLESVADELDLSSNKLTNVDGLSSLTSVGSNLFLGANSLTNVDGLIGLESIPGDLILINNALTNIDGLSSLKSVGDTLNLSGNNIVDVTGLSSLKSVGWSLDLTNNPYLKSLDGLAGLTSVNEIKIDSTAQITIPIPSGAWLCQPAQADKFPHRFMSQAEACGL